MENTQTQITIPTFQIKGRKTHHRKSVMGHNNAFPDSLATTIRQSRKQKIRCRNKRKSNYIAKRIQEKGGKPAGDCDCKEEEEEEEEEEENEDEKVEVERKIEALQRIVPGGGSRCADKLFEETAGYILALQRQVKALRAVSTLFERLEKDNSKFGA